MEEGNAFLGSFVLGFHGCDASLAQAIVNRKSKHLRLSENPFDWLGSGVYFWEANAARALDYARESMHRPAPGQGRIRTPAVIGAVIDLGYCLNLLDSQFFPVVRKGYRTLDSAYKVLGLQLPINRSLGADSDSVLRDLDCKVINTVHDLRRKKGLRAFDSVRAAFTEGRPLYKGAFFHDKNHIQICIRNVRCIRGYFHPVF